MNSLTQDQILTGFERVWNLGASFIIGWCPVEGGILAVHTPCYAVSSVALRNPALLKRRGLKLSPSEANQLVREGCARDRIDFHEPLSNNDATTNAIEKILRKFTVTYSKCRAVALFDIVKFSLNSTYEQLAQLSFLSHCINIASKYCVEQGFPMDIRTSTTGDGFYIWNRLEGFIADQALYFVTALALAANNSVVGKNHSLRGVPQLRCCIGFGEHFEYRQAASSSDSVTEYIVGDVTVDLSRLIAMALPNQLLVASYNRHLDDEEELRQALATGSIDTQTFINLSAAIAKKALGLPLPSGSTIAHIESYLTGEKLSDQESTIRKYLVTDKHGLEHRCFNLKFNISDQSGTEICVGLMEHELGSFGARHIEKEDIRVRVA